MSVAIEEACYRVPCGIVPEREFAPERTMLSTPWERARSYLLARDAARAVRLAGLRESSLRDLTDTRLDEQLRSLLPALSLRKTDTETLATALGIAREVAHREIEQRPFDEQVFAAFILLRGGLAEMATGEGKTLTASMAGAVAGISGVPVHVLSSNDYLASRDARAMRPLYERMGLRVGEITREELGAVARAAAYRCDVTYLTPSELAFDYLRDRKVLGSLGPLGRRISRIGGRIGADLRQRGLHFAIVDEADDVLLDQACTPFVLSQRTAGLNAEARAHEAFALAQECVEGRDYFRADSEFPNRLTAEGAAYIDSVANSTDRWLWPRECREWVEMALHALYGLAIDVDYIVHDGAVEIVNAPTGRRAPNQNFERGLHQLLELKESLHMSTPSASTARIAGQALFRRYRRLSAMTGTASEARGEFWRVYGLPVVRIPLRRPSNRVAGNLECHLNQEGQDEAICSTVERAVASGRPVLVGTGSVESSCQVAEALAKRGIVVDVLNATNDVDEARIISRAGEPSRVTVATNMAGRGTDIVLAPEVARRGGLHIVCTRVGESRRVDRQLFGRCARQGDPGSFETILSLSDPKIAARVPVPLLGWLRKRAGSDGKLRPWVTQVLRWSVQTAEERRAEVTRRVLLALQSGRDQLLAFAGKSE